MSDTSIGKTEQPMEQPSEDLSKAMEQISVTENSDKTSSSKNLSDMPFDVVGLVIERSDYKEQLVLRKVSKSLRALVDKQKPSCKRIQVLCVRDYITISFNDVRITYTPPNSQLTSLIKSDDFMKIALNDLAFTLKNPKLQLECIGFDFDATCGISELSKLYDRMEAVLKSINHQISVKKCCLHLNRRVTCFPVLKYLKPGVLETIYFHVYDYRNEWSTSPASTATMQFLHLKQWKQAKELQLRHSFEFFPMPSATHIKRFHFFNFYTDPVRLVRMRDVSVLTAFRVHAAPFSVSLHSPQLRALFD
ncbi:unnamed protein product [Caenorhabditis brenneri]